LISSWRRRSGAPGLERPGHRNAGQLDDRVEVTGSDVVESRDLTGVGDV
jgi:hypothetical protein